MKKYCIPGSGHGRKTVAGLEVCPQLMLVVGDFCVESLPSLSDPGVRWDCRRLNNNN